MDGTQLLVVLLFTLGVVGFSIPASEAVPTEADCTSDGQVLPDPDNCTCYYQCIMPGGSFLAVVNLDCPPGGYFLLEPDGTGSCTEGTCSIATTAPPEIEETTDLTITTEPDSSTSATDFSTTSVTDSSTTSVGSSSSPTSSITDLTDSSTVSSETETSTASEAETSVTSESSTSNTLPSFECTSAGFFAHPNDPTKYYQCVLMSSGQYYYYIYSCAANACFQESANTCVVGTCPSLINTTTGLPPGTVPDSSTPLAGSSSTPKSSSTNVADSTTVSAEPQTTLESSSTSNAMPSFECTAAGFFAHPTDPTKYYQCVLMSGQYYYYIYSCPANACFQESANTCVVGTCPSLINTTTGLPPTTAPGSFTDSSTSVDSSSTSADSSSTSDSSSISSDSSSTSVDASSTPVDASSTSLEGSSSTPESSSTDLADSTTTETSSTSNVLPPFECTSAGFFAHPTDPAKYYQCILISSQFYYYIYTCPANACFQESAKMCVVGSCSSSVNATTNFPPTTPSASNGTTVITTTPEPLPTFTCTAVGEYIHPTDPSKYYQCVLVGSQFYYYIYSCPPNACFSTSTSLCVVGGCTATPNVTTSSPVVTTSPAPVTIQCDKPGPTPYPNSCTKYYNCVLLADGFVYYVFECPPGGYFDPIKALCVVGQCPTMTTIAQTTASSTTSTTTTTSASTTPSTTVVTTTVSSSTTPPTTAVSISTSSSTITTLVPVEDHPCPSEGYFADSSDCQSYYKCVIMNGYMYRYMFQCPPGAYWSNSPVPACIIGACPST